ncbi:unnamed protein product [Diatraea saccharalis]|uniref:Uncharacterized protein n=1 Tax=Diatraea saccharalis TaxID=40085 RepID=A0A9N9N096_9NEOP|nr:unnamed protein product [Diatraea saccharalis]
MYTPKQEVQYVFPDLSIQYGDLMMIMFETRIEEALNSSGNFIPLKPHKHHHHTETSLSETKTDAGVDSVPMGFDTDIMKMTNEQPHIENVQQYNDYNLVGGNHQDFFNEDTHKHEHGQDKLDPGVTSDSLSANERDISEYMLPNADGVVKNCSPLNKDCNVSSLNKKGIKVLPVENLILEYPTNSERESEEVITGDHSHDTHTHGINHKKNLEHHHDYSKSELNVDNIFDPIASLYGLHTNFNEWFNQQIYVLNNNDKQLDSIYDLEYLKLKIREILQDNRIKIIDGILYNKNGVPINAANLKLHLISIGDTSLYKNLLNLKGISSLLPTNLKNVDIIAVTQTFPSKLLGVVPLKKACDSHTPYRRMYRNPAIYPMGWQPNPHVHNTPYYFSSPYFSYPYNRRSAAIPSNYPIYWYQTGQHNNKRKNSPRIGKLHKKPLDSLKSLFDLRVGSLSLPGTVIDLLNSVANPNDVAKDEDYEIYDDIGIRIIGGNPATSSGTPISNKGRSAALYI